MLKFAKLFSESSNTAMFSVTVRGMPIGALFAKGGKEMDPLLTFADFCIIIMVS